jgi:hypothetical protein
MKSLINPKSVISADGKTATVTFDIVEQTFSDFPSQRWTVGHLNPSNIKHPRHVMVSNEAIFVKYFTPKKRVQFAIPIDDFVLIAAQIEPQTTFPPAIKTLQSLTAEVSSEINPSFQWQVTDSIEIKPVPLGTAVAPVVWTDVVGQTTKTLDKASIKTGQWVRLRAYSDAGEMFSNPVKVM